MSLIRAMTDDAPVVSRGSGRPLRILIAAFSARNALQQLLDELFFAMSRRTDCHVAVPTHYAGAIPEQALLRVPCGVTKAGGVVASIDPVAHWITLSALRRVKPDVIHILTGEGYLWAVTLTLAARTVGVPVVVTLHDPDPHPGNVVERLNAVIRHPVLRLSKVIHVFSAQHLARAGALAPRAQCEVIPHGSLAGQFLSHRQPGVPRENLVLLFGRLQHYKGIDILCRAMLLLPAGLRLAIAGPGVLGETERQLISALGDRIELHNAHLDDAKVALLMQRASVVALPYRHVTQSSVPAIAAAFGCSVVASALGHFIEEIPQIGGVLVPPEDAGALAQALSQVMAAPPAATVVSPTFHELAPSFEDLYRSAQRMAQRRRQLATRSQAR